MTISSVFKGKKKQNKAHTFIHLKRVLDQSTVIFMVASYDVVTSGHREIASHLRSPTSRLIADSRKCLTNVVQTRRSVLIADNPRIQGIQRAMRKMEFVIIL